MSAEKAERDRLQRIRSDVACNRPLTEAEARSLVAYIERLEMRLRELGEKKY